MSADAVLEVEELSVSFLGPKGWVRVVDQVSFRIEAGQVLGIVGESGSGKTVSCLAAMGLLDPSISRIEPGSRIRVDGQEVVGMRRRDLDRLRGTSMAMIFQEPMTSLNPAFTVGDQISEGLRVHRGMSRKAARSRAIELLDTVGIPDPARVVHAYPHAFSGGMRQRVMIALALACEPRLIIADEPTTALDVTVQAQILELLRSMREELGVAILFITHDLGVIAEVCDDVVVMYAGQIVETAPVDDLFADPRHPYTEGLLAAMPSLGSDIEQLGVIPGRVPNPWEFPKGCRFEQRCPYAGPECGQPTVRHVIGDHRTTACHRVGSITLEGVE